MTIEDKVQQVANQFAAKLAERIKVAEQPMSFDEFTGHRLLGRFGCHHRYTEYVVKLPLIDNLSEDHDAMTAVYRMAELVPNNNPERFCELRMPMGNTGCVASVVTDPDANVSVRVACLARYRYGPDMTLMRLDCAFRSAEPPAGPGPTAT